MTLKLLLKVVIILDINRNISFRYYFTCLKSQTQYPYSESTCICSYSNVIGLTKSEIERTRGVTLPRYIVSIHVAILLSLSNYISPRFQLHVVMSAKLFGLFVFTPVWFFWGVLVLFMLFLIISVWSHQWRGNVFPSLALEITSGVQSVS